MGKRGPTGTPDGTIKEGFIKTTNKAGRSAWRIMSHAEAGIPQTGMSRHTDFEKEYYAAKTELFRLVCAVIGEGQFYSFLKLAEIERERYCKELGLTREYECMRTAYINIKGEGGD